MKGLNEYINEQRVINEGSLFGDIIRTMLGWVGSSVAWAANWFKEGVGELWKTFKNVNEKVWERGWTQFNERNRHGYKITPPRNEKELAEVMTKITEKGTVAEKIATLEELKKALIDAGVDKDAVEQMFAEQVYLIATATKESNDSKISKEDKENAQKALEALNKNYKKYVSKAEQRTQKYNKKSKK